MNTDPNADPIKVKCQYFIDAAHDALGDMAESLASGEADALQAYLESAESALDYVTKAIMAAVMPIAIAQSNRPTRGELS